MYDSRRMARATLRVAATAMMPTVLGRRWRSMIRAPEAPSPRAPCTNSRSRRASIWARTWPPWGWGGERPGAARPRAPRRPGGAQSRPHRPRGGEGEGRERDGPPLSRRAPPRIDGGVDERGEEVADPHHPRREHEEAH